MNNKYIDIVFCFDLRMLAPAAVTIASLLDTNTDKNTHYNIYCVSTDDVSVIEKTLSKVVSKRDEKSNLKMISASDFFKDSFEIRNISVATYLRLLLPELLPDNVEKIIYSDVDILFLKSINELDSVDMSNCCYGGVLGLNVMLNAPEDISAYLSNDSSNNYINAGFLLLNLNELRKSYDREFFINESQKKYLYQDQDIINYNFRDRIKLLPLSYNVNASEKTFLAAIEKGVITQKDYDDYNKTGRILKHYTGQKPWDNMYVDSENLWIKYVLKNKDLRKICKNLLVFKSGQYLKLLLKEVFSIKNVCINDKKYKVVVLFGKEIIKKEKKCR